jgi:hypothetical protein
MLNLCSIVVNFNNKSEIHLDYSSFKNSRFNHWKAHCNINQGLRNFLQHAKQSAAEELLEARFALRPKALEGICLIFGTGVSAQKILENPALRQVITDPLTSVQITVSEIGVESSLCTHDGTRYLFHYPASLTLLPQFQ